MFMPAAGGRRRVLPSSRKCYESELRTEKRIMILSHPLCVETETRSTIRLIYIYSTKVERNFGGMDVSVRKRRNRGGRRKTFSIKIKDQPSSKNPRW